MSTAKPFRRISSLVRLKSRQYTPYQSWEDDQDGAEQSGGSTTPATEHCKPVVEFTALSSPEALCAQDRILRPVLSESGQTLVECFYLGSTDMSGLEIRGRGCIDSPAAVIWEQSQQDRKSSKRKNSWSSKHQHESSTNSNGTSFKPRYVRLATGADALLVHDNSTNELIIEFPYKKISFVGTHPKYTRLFAFIATPTELTAPFCHAFKCEDQDSAKQAACSLSDVFSQKIKELMNSAQVTQS